jgi:pimeloyl-ACP methyl ester carboxylesterase
MPSSLDFGDGFDPSLRHDRITANGVDLHVVSAGEGPTVLLVHGNPSTWLVWRRIMPALARSHRVVAPDLRGFGDSARPLRGYDKATLARDMEGVMDAMGVDEFDVIGHDFGSQIGYRLAKLAPERVRRLVVIEGLLPEITTEPFPDQSRFWFVPFSMQPDLPELLTLGRESST